jgi:hypothetical protein
MVIDEARMPELDSQGRALGLVWVDAKLEGFLDDHFP